MIRTVATVTMVGLFSAVTLTAAPKEYMIDSAHSYVGFSVSHMVLSKTKGSFSEYSGRVTWDAENPAKSILSGVVSVASIDTKDAKRDDHLRSKDFFDAEKYPKMTFETTKIEKRKTGYYLHGKLSIKGVTKDVSTPLIAQGPIKDPWGNSRMHFNASFEINRQDYGITWNNVMDNGGLVVGNQVAIDVDIEAIAK